MEAKAELRMSQPTGEAAPQGIVPSQPGAQGKVPKFHFVHRWSQKGLIDIPHGNWIPKHLQESCEEAAGEVFL